MEEAGIRQMVVAGNLFWGAVRINQRGQQQLQPIFAGFEPEARILEFRHHHTAVIQTGCFP